VQSVAPSSAQSCTSAHSRLASLHLGASRLAQLTAARHCVAAFGRPATCTASRMVQLKAARRPTAASRLCTSKRRVAQLAAASRPLAVPLCAERRAWFSSKLHSGPQPPRVTPPRSVACSTALAVPLRAERRAWFSSKLHSGPQPPRVTPPRSVACSTARRCAAALGRPAAGIASRLVQAKAARRPTAASHHSTSERRV